MKPPESRVSDSSVCTENFVCTDDFQDTGNRMSFADIAAEHNRLTLLRCDPVRFGWTGIGSVADVIDPYNKSLRRMDDWEQTRNCHEPDDQEDADTGPSERSAVSSALTSYLWGDSNQDTVPPEVVDECNAAPGTVDYYVPPEDDEDGIDLTEERKKRLMMLKDSVMSGIGPDTHQKKPTVWRPTNNVIDMRISFPLCEDAVHTEIFEWDLSDPKTPSVEAFASATAMEYGLNFHAFHDLLLSMQLQLDDAIGRMGYRVPVAKFDPYLSARNTLELYSSTEPIRGNAPSLHASGDAPSSDTKENALSLRSRGGRTRSGKAGKRCRSSRSVVSNSTHLAPTEPVVLSRAEELYESVKKKVLESLHEKACKVVTEPKRAYIVKDRYCHICHHLKPSGIKFRCSLAGHIYCETHVENRLNVSLEEACSMRHCPICSLQCACSKCKNRLKCETMKEMRKAEAKETSIETPKTRRKQKKNSDDDSSYDETPKDKKSSSVTSSTKKRNYRPNTDPLVTLKNNTPSSFPSSNKRRQSSSNGDGCSNINGFDSQPGMDDELDEGLDSNVDNCSICGAIGMLICCDRCPRAFHKECLDYVDESDDEWICHVCKLKEHKNPVRDLAKGKAYFPKVKKLFSSWIKDGNDKYFTILSRIAEITDRLMKYEFGYAFKEPVDLDDHAWYSDMVKIPMDLGTISKRLKEPGGYNALRHYSLFQIITAVLRDIQRVWENCLTYNKKNSAIYRMAEVQERICNHMISCSISLYLSYEETQSLGKFQDCFSSFKFHSTSVKKLSSVTPTRKNDVSGAHNTLQMPSVLMNNTGNIPTNSSGQPYIARTHDNRPYPREIQKESQSSNNSCNFFTGLSSPALQNSYTQNSSLKAEVNNSRISGDSGTKMISSWRGSSSFGKLLCGENNSFKVSKELLSSKKEIPNVYKSNPMSKYFGGHVCDEKGYSEAVFESIKRNSALWDCPPEPQAVKCTRLGRMRVSLRKRSNKVDNEELPPIGDFAKTGESGDGCYVSEIKGLTYAEFMRVKRSFL